MMFLRSRWILLGFLLFLTLVSWRFMLEQQSGDPPRKPWVLIDRRCPGRLGEETNTYFPGGSKQCNIVRLENQIVLMKGKNKIRRIYFGSSSEFGEGG
jgi:hypothetical protein